MTAPSSTPIAGSNDIRVPNAVASSVSVPAFRARMAARGAGSRDPPHRSAPVVTCPIACRTPTIPAVRAAMGTVSASALRNSMATSVPRGIRSTAGRNAVVTSPVVTPRPMSGGAAASNGSQGGPRDRDEDEDDRTYGELEPRGSRGGPTAWVRPTESAAPNWTESMAATAIIQGGTGVPRLPDVGIISAHAFAGSRRSRPVWSRHFRWRPSSRCLG